MTEAPAAADTPQGEATPDTPGARLAQKWIARIDAAEKDLEQYVKRCDRIRRLYVEERRQAGLSMDPTNRRFALLWSNEQTLLPALYARTPQPVCERRFKDTDPVALGVAECLQRSLVVTLDTGDFDHTMRQCVYDYTTYARGVAWVRYEPKFATVTPRIPVQVAEGAPAIRADTMEPVETFEQDEAGAFVAGDPEERLEYECVKIDYVHHSDFVHPVARSWDEVMWVARRVYMTKADMELRFGKKIAAAVPTSQQEMPGDQGQRKPSAPQTAPIYEIWDKKARKVLFVCKAHTSNVLAEDEPYYELDGFFPCPRPAYGTLSTDSLIPVPDYVYYQDQAEEINELTAKIGVLGGSLRAVGFYRGEDATKLNQAFNPTNKDILVPVAGWSEFKEGGGAAAMIEWVPIDKVVQALKACFETRQLLVQDVYQITGISDIVRGASDPNETATAQQIKAQFGSIRIRDRQAEIQRFARDLMRLAGEVIAERFQPETLQAMTGMQVTPEMLALMRGDQMRTFRVDIETDSTIALDEQAEKEAATEFLTAVGGFLQQAVPVAQVAPELKPLLGKMLLFASRRYRTGRELDADIEAAVEQMSQPPQPAAPDPQVQLEQQAQQLEAQKVQQEGQLRSVELQQESQRIQIEAEQAKTDRMATMSEGRARLIEARKPNPPPARAA